MIFIYIKDINEFSYSKNGEKININNEKFDELIKALNNNTKEK